MPTVYHPPNGSAAIQSEELWHQVPRFAGRRVLVVGDVMLDRFIYGGMDRISPEAPVPIIRHDSEGRMLGGAGNVAANILSLGGVPLLVGLIGQDAEGGTVRNLCGDLGIGTQGLVSTESRPTAVKTRFIAHGQQVLRYDREHVGAVDAAERRALLAAFDQALAEAEIAVLSDYGKGVLMHGVAAELIGRARASGLRVIVDPKGSDYSRYLGANLITPNLKELREATGTDAQHDAEITTAARLLVQRLDLDGVIVTRSADGMSVVGREAATHVPTVAREVFDVSGAGDTVVSTVALALADGLDFQDAARIANAAAGVVVGKRGTAQVSPPELIIALRGVSTRESRVADRVTAAMVAKSWKGQGLSVGFTNGCFDILHAGHVSLVEQAKSMCDRLILGLNSDASVRRLKGPERPINAEGARASVLAALGAVDLVVIFDEDTPLSLIEAIEPNVLVKGSDYSVETVVGADFVIAHGGRVELARLVDGHSTTQTVARVRGAPVAQSQRAIAEP